MIHIINRLLGSSKKSKPKNRKRNTSSARTHRTINHRKALRRFRECREAKRNHAQSQKSEVQAL